IGTISSSLLFTHVGTMAGVRTQSVPRAGVGGGFSCLFFRFVVPFRFPPFLPKKSEQKEMKVERVKEKLKEKKNEDLALFALAFTNNLHKHVSKTFVFLT